MSKRLSHALHNEIVCDSLCSDKSNVDWIVTIAFYSALHFLEHKVFPLKQNHPSGGKLKFKDFGEYYNFATQGQKPKKNMHAVRQDLAKMYIPTASPDYNWLKNTCWTARYTDYKFSDEHAYIEKAKECLKNIKKACTT